jgi:hypothetical protein
VVGGAVATPRLETHLPETFARLRYPGTAMAKGRGGGPGPVDALLRRLVYRR